MTRTNQQARGQRNRASKTENGRKLDSENKELNQQARKATKAAKRAKPSKDETSGLQQAEKTNGDILNAKEDTSMSIDEGNNSAQTAQSVSNEHSSMNTTTSITISPDLARSHEITTMSILSSSQIQQRVTRALSILSVYPAVAPAKPAVVVLYAKARAAAKMISIAEIVKREIAGEEGKWFQYNRVEGVVGELKSKAGGKGKEKEDVDKSMEDVEQSDEEEEAFEIMKTPFERAIEGTAKVRAVPVMTICLSRVRVESLRREYGEQTNGLDVPKP